MSRSVRKQQDDVTELELVATSQEEESDDYDTFSSVDTLQHKGIGASDITKLKNAGLYTVGMVKKTIRKKLIMCKGLSEAKVDKIIEAAKAIERSGFITGVDALLRSRQVIKITTGCKALDTLLGGGVETRAITEIFGENRSGKTQLCHTLAVTSMLPHSSGGGNGKVCWIDTEGTFRAEKIKDIAQRFGLDPEAVLSNIMVCRAYNTEEQYEQLVEVASLCHEDQFRLLVVDSIMALYRVDYQGRGELSERQQNLNQMMSRLIKLAEEYNIAVFMTNQVQADPGGMSFVADPKKPVGGHILAHASTHRLYVRKGRGDTRVAKIYSSPNLAEADATFQLGADGVTDAEE